jgi:hypothetical protein
MADATPVTPTDDVVAETLAFVDGALGAAGHRVDDAPSRELLRQQAAGEITADDAIAELKRREGLA